MNLNAKEQPVLKDLQAIQTGTQDTTVTRQTKLDIYTQRLQNANFGTNLTPETVQHMSLAQFVGRVDRRGKKLSLRKKHAIVKEKPYLNLDSRRPNAGDMARYALRLHRPFVAATDDPGLLSDKDAIEQLHTFVESAVCPLWLKQRFRRQNKVKKAKGRRTGDVAFLPVVPDAPPAASEAASTGADVAFLPVASGVVPSAGSEAADTGADGCPSRLVWLNHRQCLMVLSSRAKTCPLRSRIKQMQVAVLKNPKEVPEVVSKDQK